jgi:uncharacterized membrane protein
MKRQSAISSLVLKTLKTAMSATLVTPILVGVSGMVLQSSAQASTTFCNKTHDKVELAYARGEKYSPFGSSSHGADISTDYKVKGWWKINPGHCTMVDMQSAYKVSRNSREYYVSQLYYAKTKDSHNRLTGWSGETNFCVKNANFTSFRSFGGFAGILPRTCDHGYYEVGFQSFSSNGHHVTIDLKNPTSHGMSDH